MARLRPLAAAPFLAVLAAALAFAACRSTRPAGAPAGGVPPAAAAPSASAPAPEWWRTAVFYEVFVRSFQDSNGDGIGDLRGLASRLDYLNDGDPSTTHDLGIDALWLMPIFESPSYHGYDTTDYERVDPDYGTDADLDHLLAEAHRRGLRVVVDLMLNHTSVQHPWFVESASSPSSPRRDWYVWSPTDLGWTQPWNTSSGSTWHERNGAYYYGVFWGGMPDLNFRNPAVRAEATRISKAWLARGIDGFRLDAIRHLVETGPGEGQAGSPENHAFLKEYAAALKAAKPSTVLVGEVWSNTYDIADYYGDGKDELDLLFDFPLSTAIVEGVRAGDPTNVALTLEEVARAYPKGAVDAPFLTNHDQIRIATQVGHDPAKLRAAAAILLTVPGAPFVYYGEELGLPNGPNNDDEWKRTPMPWKAVSPADPGRGFTTAARPWHRFTPRADEVSVEAQAGDPGSLLARYRALVRARKASPALLAGDLAVAPQAAGVPALAFVRRGGGETVVVAHNLGTAPAEAAVAAPGGTAEPIFADPGAALAGGGGAWKASLPAGASGIWRVRE